MKVIGITGGIGTGKSTILHIMQQEKGVYIVETDALAHKLMEPGQSIYNSVVEVFGTEILLSDKTINRSRLSGIVFADKSKLEQLNAIVHPAVKEYIASDMEAKRREGCVAFYVVESALLIETGYKSVCDEIWFIFLEREERIRRLIAGRGGNREKYEKIMENQMPEEYYMKHCDIMINNGSTFEKTANLVKRLLFSSR